MFVQPHEGRNVEEALGDLKDYPEAGVTAKLDT